MNIGIDVDGVLVDLERYQLEVGEPYFRKKLGKQVVDSKAYDIEQIFGCTAKERECFWTRYIWAYCISEPMMQGASDVIRNLQREGHKIFIITGRAHTIGKGILGVLFRWMLKNWLWRNQVRYEEIIFCSEKESSRDKQRICIEKNIELMIDDKMENLYALPQTIKTICFAAVWNEGCEEKGFTRVNGWNEIEDVIKSESNGTDFAKDK